MEWVKVRRWSRVALCGSLGLLLVHAAAAAELLVFAGAGLRPPVQQLAERFQQREHVAVQIEYGGSGALLNRIRESGRGDVFVPGSLRYAEPLQASHEVLAVLPLVQHAPVIAVNRAAAQRIETFADLAKPGVKIGLGDPQAMALGRTAAEILDHSGLRSEIEANVVVRAATVKQLALYVADGDVDAAIIGATDYAEHADKLVLRPIPAGWFKPEIAGAVVLRSSADPALAKRFAEFMASEEGLTTFEHFGFPRATAADMAMPAPAPAAH